MPTNFSVRMPTFSLQDAFWDLRCSIFQNSRGHTFLYFDITCRNRYWGVPPKTGYFAFPNKFLWIIKLNPFAYIIIGMREALLFNLPFWIHYKGTLYFWGLTLALFVIGNYTFNKLKGHFADVL